MPSRRRLGGWFGSAASAALLAGTLRPARADARLRFGLTPVFLDSDLELLELLSSYLEARLGRGVELVKRRSYQEITLLLLGGQLEAAWICGYPFVQYEDRLSLVAVPLWRGEPLYRSYLIAHEGRPHGDLEDLRGNLHAFSDPDSNSGYLVTAALLAERGEQPGSFFRHSFFTYGHRNVIRAVARGLADSGSVDGYVFDVLAEREPSFVQGAVVVARSEKLGFPPIACRRELRATPSLGALAEAFTAMGEDGTGRAVLDALRLDGFAAGSPDLFDGIAARWAAVRHAA